MEWGKKLPRDEDERLKVGKQQGGARKRSVSHACYETSNTTALVLVVGR